MIILAKTNLNLIMTKIYSRIFLVLMFLISFNLLHAQDKYVMDPDFNAAFQTNTHFIDGKNITATVAQQDGKVLVVYDTYEYVISGTAQVVSKVVRINADYTLDTSYNAGEFDGTISSIALQNNGKIILVGTFKKYNTTNSYNIVRLNSDGTLDTGFAVGSGFNYYVYADPKTPRKIKIQSDNKILIAGNFWSYNGVTKKYMIRLNTDGSIDNTFTFDDSYYDNEVKDFDLQPDGKIVAMYSTKVARFNTDGSLDSSFSTIEGSGSTEMSGRLYCIAVRNDGKIYLGGRFVISLNRQYVARLNADGTLDSTFMPKKFFNQTWENQDRYGIFSFLIQPDGKVLAGGCFKKYGTDQAAGILRLNDDATIDTSFQGKVTGMINGYSDQDVISHLSYYNDGSILASGNIRMFNEVAVNNMVRFSSNGTINMAFRNICKGFDRAVHKLFVQPDGKIIATGYFFSYNGFTADRIIRLNADGSVDETFKVDTHLYMQTSNFPVDIRFQPDGKILMGTNGFIYTSGLGAFGGAVIRLNNNGSLDTSFFSLAGTDIGLEGSMDKFILKGDGKVVVPNMYRYNSTVNLNYEITSLDTDGNLDNTITYQKPYSDIRSLKLLPDGKILLTGKNANSSKRTLGRLLPNGTIDPIFFQDSSQPDMIEYYPTPDGKILTLGNTATAHRISRFNNDGTLDASFSQPTYPITGTPLQQQPLEFENNGKFFTTVLKTFDPRNLVRHNADGSYDTTFDIGSGFTMSHTSYYGDIVSSVKKQNNGFLVGGEFSAFNGQYAKGITRLILQNSLNVKEANTGKKNLIYPNPTTGIINIKAEGYSQYEVKDNSGRTIVPSSKIQSTIDVSHLTAGIYYILLKNGKETSVQKFIKK